MDFTVKKYRELLEALQESFHSFQTVEQYLQNPAPEVIILRHDVDYRKLNALEFARIEHKMDIRATYYFRVAAECYDERIIRKIAGMGHEIGYHYEDLSMADGDPEKGIVLFKQHLGRLRNIANVTTACMHGRPLSSYDNRDLWKDYDYRDYGIIGEPYFSIDFSNVFYLTDTGRRWDGANVSLRDTVWVPDASEYMVPVKTTGINEGFSRDRFHSTQSIVEAIKEGNFLPRVLFNIHPNRWTDKPTAWIKELIWQNIKNIPKAWIKAMNI